MNQDPIIQRCYAMNDQELVSALTLDKAEYSDLFREIASRELAQRGVKLSGFLNSVEVSLNNQEEEVCTIDQALSKLKQDVSFWDMWIFTNCLDESLVFQKESLRWVIHHYCDEKYEKSFFIGTQEEAEKLLSRFLYLEDWKDFIDLAYDLDAWEVLVESKSHNYIRKIATVLDTYEVLYTVQTPIFSQDQNNFSAVLIPEEYMETSKEIVTEIESKVRDLYTEASKLAEGDDPIKELEIYNMLIQLVSDDPMVLYNRGSILFELGHYEEAVDSFSEAVSIAAEEIDTEVKLRLSSLSRAYPEFIDDAEIFLIQILEKMPQHLKILHCLASISMLKNDPASAEERYSRILSIEPSDRIAQLSVSHLRSENR